jgi:hypothetical protein
MTGGEVAIYLAIAGASTAAYSQYQQGKSAAANAKAEAAWHAYNAKVAENEAEAERKAAEFEAQQQNRQAKQLKARQRALIGASGVTTEGSPLLVLEDTAAQLALENAQIREQGARRVSAYKSQSILDFSKARSVSKSAKGYSRAGLLSAGGTLLQGLGTAAYMKSQLPGKIGSGLPTAKNLSTAQRKAGAVLAKY